MTGIPRGVVDANTGRAVVHDRNGTLVAVDVASGNVLWRAGHGLRPCSMAGDTVVAVRVGDGNTLTVVTIDARDGRELWSSPPIPLPDWVHPTLDDTPGFALHAETNDRQVTLRWMARKKYEGGAPPSQETLEKQTHEAAGVVRLDLETFSVQNLPEPTGAWPEERAARERAPDVVGHAEVGALRFELTIRAGGDTGAVVLRAVDRDSAQPRWEVVLDDAVQRRAPRRRP